MATAMARIMALLEQGITELQAQISRVNVNSTAIDSQCSDNRSSNPVCREPAVFSGYLPDT